MRDFLRYGYRPDYWRWRWQRVSDVGKVGVAVMIALLLGLGGYVAAKGLAGANDTTAAYVPPTPRAVKVATVHRTVVRRSKGKDQVVTQVQTVAIASPGTTVPETVVVQRTTQRVITDSRDRTVTIPGQRQTVLKQVTVRRPGRDRVATQGKTATVVQAQTVDRPVTVTSAVAGPPQTVTNQVTSVRTVTGPTQTVTNQVTSPGRTVTVTGPAETVTATATQPPRTVTETTTNSVTTTVPVTVTVTVTQPKGK